MATRPARQIFPSNQRHASRSHGEFTAPLKFDPSDANNGHIVAGQKVECVMGIPRWPPAPYRPRWPALRERSPRPHHPVRAAATNPAAEAISPPQPHARVRYLSPAQARTGYRPTRSAPNWPPCHAMIVHRAPHDVRREAPSGSRGTALAYPASQALTTAPARPRSAPAKHPARAWLRRITVTPASSRAVDCRSAPSASARSKTPSLAPFASARADSRRRWKSPRRVAGSPPRRSRPGPRP